MKTTHRSIPNDIFSVEEGGKTVRIIRSHNAVHVSTASWDSAEFSMLYSFDEFHAAIEALLMAHPPSPPSSDDKEAATPPYEGKNSQS